MQKRLGFTTLFFTDRINCCILGNWVFIYCDYANCWENRL